MIDILKLLKRVKKSPKGWSACCPAHDDKHHSLSVAQGDDGRWLVQCHYAGCSVDDICTRSSSRSPTCFQTGPLKTPRKRRARGKKSPLNPSGNSATVQQSGGLTLADFAAAKALPIDFLQRCGVAEQTYDGAPAVRFPFYSTDGELLSTHFPHRAQRRPLPLEEGRQGRPIRQNHLAEASRRGTSIVIVEGESDCALKLHKISAIAMPGGSQWNELRDSLCSTASTTSW